MRTPTSFRFFAPFTLAAALAACTPPATQDGGTVDGGQDEDAGAPVDAGHDAGEPPPPPPDGGGSECPAITGINNHIGEPCAEEGVVCRESGCFAPGPSCLFIECHNGEWVNQALIDGGSVPEDAGTDAGANGDDAGDDETDGGDSEPDAGDGEPDAADGGSDAG